MRRRTTPFPSPRPQAGCLASLDFSSSANAPGGGAGADPEGRGHVTSGGPGRAEVAAAAAPPPSAVAPHPPRSRPVPALAPRPLPAPPPRAPPWASRCPRSFRGSSGRSRCGSLWVRQIERAARLGRRPRRSPPAPASLQRRSPGTLTPRHPTAKASGAALPCKPGSAVSAPGLKPGAGAWVG